MRNSLEINRNHGYADKFVIYNSSSISCVMTISLLLSLVSNPKRFNILGEASS